VAPGVANLAGLRECHAGRLASSLRDIVDLFSGLSSSSVADWIPRTLAASCPGHLGWRPRPDTSVAAKRAARHVLVRPRILQAPYSIGANGSEGRDSIVQPSSLASWRPPARQVMLTGGYGLSSSSDRRGALRPADLPCARGDKRTRHPGHEAAGRRRGKPAHDRPVQRGASRARLRPVRSGQGERGGGLVPGRDPPSGRHPGPRIACRQLRWLPTGARYGRSDLFPQGFPARPRPAAGLASCIGPVMPSP